MKKFGALLFALGFVLFLYGAIHQAELNIVSQFCYTGVAAGMCNSLTTTYNTLQVCGALAAIVGAVMTR